MRKFIGLNRVCVPLSLDCDLSCRYCYRNGGRIARVPDFNDLMREFLGQIDPSKTQAVVASGGEPLLHWDKVQELFSYVSPKQHVKVMTNGLNLTPEVVKYLNDRRVEVWVSHDGDWTEYLRGVDVFKDAELLKLIRSIDHLTVSGVITNRNPNPYKVYEEIKRVLQRPFYFHLNPVFASDFCKDLVADFDYEAFRDGYLHCILEHLDWVNPIPKQYRGVGCNVLPNGDVVGMVEIHHKYGTVLDDAETLIKAREAFGDTKPCLDNGCPAYGLCNLYQHEINPHACAIKIKRIEVAEALKDAS